MSLARSLAACGLIGLVAAWSFAASAQPVYRIVGPDGRVTFSDRPPTEPGTKASTAAVGGSSNAAAIAALPFEVRTAVGRYPVTLYSGPNCGPCDAGRSFLNNRGIPFTERTVSTSQDIEALNRLSGGSAALPMVTIGAQQLKGFSEPEWSQFLDAAGYPRISQLPATYRQPDATPLVVAQQPARPAAAASAARARAEAPAQPEPAGPTPDNPAGIRF